MIASLVALHVTAKARLVNYEMFSFGSAKYHIVLADVPSGNVTCGVTHSKRLTSVWNMVGKEKPVAAITGTFFNLPNAKPVGDVVIDGNEVVKGQRGSAVGFDYYGGVKIFDTKFDRRVFWGDYRYGLRGVVRLISNGKVCPNPKAQKFRDSHIWGRAARTALAINKTGKVMLVATNSQVTLSELGKALKSRGAYDAVSLDGGGSTCLYYRGSLLVSPKRQMSNMIVIWERPPFSTE